MVTVAELIDNQSAIHPNKIAIKHGERTCTYQAVNELSNKFAKIMMANGVMPGDILGVAVNRSPEMIILLLAVIKTGAAYLPIDINFPTDRINYMLNDSGVKVMITQKQFETQYQDNFKVICVENMVSESNNYNADTVPVLINEDSLAYILYTSGSTGRPKGCKVKHIGLTNLLLSVQKLPGMVADDVMLHITTISFDIAELEIYLPLITGATVVIADAEIARDARALLETAINENITIMQGTPFMWRTMLEIGWVQRLPIKIFCGGEAMSKDLAQKLVVRCNELWNMYGPTETTIYSIIKKVEQDDEVITIGHPIDNTQVYILDENLNKVADGEVGEIYITGAGVAEGYIHKPELTAERFIDNKFSGTPGSKMYKTGDLGKILDNGEILCLGRVDHQIKIRGYRIETEEIEFQLKQQPNIKEALITLYEDSLHNEHLIAYVVPAKKIDPANQDNLVKQWKSALGEKLPVYMVPGIYTVIDSIPLMPNGKIDRHSLPEPVINKYSKSYEAPHTATEIALANICLKSIATDKIGINDNFFEIGINSLMAVSIMVQVEKEFGKRLPLSVMMKYPTIKELAQVIENPSLQSTYKTLVPIKPAGSKIPVYIIHGIGLNLLNVYNMVSNLDIQQPVYGIQSIGLDGTMEVPDTIEEIAAFYIKEVLKHDPVGPYAFAGYSFGGFIGFEMVKQLKAMGKDVKLLAMFDTNLQLPSHQYSLPKKFAVKFLRQFKKFGYRIFTILNQPLDLAKYLRENNKARVKSMLNRFGILEKQDGEGLPEFMQEISNKLNHAFLKYRVQPYHVKIDIFKAKKRLYYIDDSKYLGWSEYALDGVEVHSVPGDHKDMFDEGNSKILANIFQRRLDEMNS